MAQTLIIYVEFEDEPDFDFFRNHFIGACEDIAAEAMDDEEAPKADGKIEVGWEVEDR
jgi:hypothetical protein